MQFFTNKTYKVQTVITIINEKFNTVNLTINIYKYLIMNLTLGVDNIKTFKNGLN